MSESQRVVAQDFCRAAAVLEAEIDQDAGNVNGRRESLARVAKLLWEQAREIASGLPEP